MTGTLHISLPKRQQIQNTALVLEGHTLGGYMLNNFYGKNEVLILVLVEHTLGGMANNLIVIARPS